jgi:hypothetical protein
LHDWLAFILSQSELLEITNSFVFVICLNLTLLLGWYIVREWKTFGRLWVQEDGVEIVILMFWIFGIFAIRNGAVWLALHLDAINLKTGHTLLSWMLIIVSALFSIVILRATYLFSPINKRWLWQASLALAFAFTLLFENI